MKLRVNLDQMISPHFDYVLYSSALNKVLKGGRGSTKSSVISLQIVLDFLQDENANALIIRKVANTIELSVYEQIKWAIYMIGVQSQFAFTKSPYRITHKPTGTSFYFSGLDDPAKLKSMIIAKGYICQLWFEELAEFSSWEEVDTVRASFTRKVLPPGKHVVTYYSYNPPKNPYDWINEWVSQKMGKDKWYVDHSTYQDVTLPDILAEDYLDEIEIVKQNDYNYYQWMYKGKVIGLGNSIYNMDLFYEINQLPDNDYIAQLAYSIDVGHQTSATTCLCIGLTGKNNVILLDTYYYSPAGQTKKKSPGELARDIHDFIADSASAYPNAPIVKRTIDSAEGGLRNQYYSDYGTRLHGVNKAMRKETMIDYPQELLAQGRVFILRKKTNEIFITQHQQYRWDEKTIATSDPKVIKENDHTCDAFQYFCIDNKRLLGLKK
ncbi:PBSX family phage terminase large subunit [Latilactobacillus curvatus]|uniref:PBSX family phage terminase large subunit n=1 Tax=Latilactobacillus curvatus TaxID=28038 RepID=UPI001CBC123F|nr:PBSX family phage terminase large subunit [Latilactobacillus curvatus]MBZ1504042.1 PBSX family phage terminase large subunit [Latilactobacillus curvatus]